MRPVPDHLVFSRGDALALGWTDPALRRAVRSGRLTRVRRGQFTTADPDPTVRAIAAAASCSGSVISHRSAALLHGLPLLGRAPDRADLTLSPPSTGDTANALVHRATLRDIDVVAKNDVPVTSVARSVADLARCSRTATAVTAIDAALHAESVGSDEITDVLAFCRTWPRIGDARRALALSDGLAESALESLSRLVLARLGLPRPRLQVPIVNERGVVIKRADFYWDEAGVAGEADGRLKYTDRDVLTGEKELQEECEDLGLIVVRWGWDLALRRTVLLKQRVERGLARGHARDASGFPRLWSVG